MKGTFRVGPVRLERIRKQVNFIVGANDDDVVKRTATEILEWVENKGRMTYRQSAAISAMAEDAKWNLVK